jgi:hypothetical protein
VRAILRGMDEDITFRVSTGEGSDADSLRRLATNGCGQSPAGPVVLAERDGEPVAAIGIADGQTLTDPRRVTTWALTLLRLRRLETKAIIAVFGA